MKRQLLVGRCESGSHLREMGGMITEVDCDAVNSAWLRRYTSGAWINSRPTRGQDGGGPWPGHRKPLIGLPPRKEANEGT